MAKKLLSILCALTMLVSMATIAVVTVSAEEPTLDKSFKPLSEAAVTLNTGSSDKYDLAATGTFTNDPTYGDGFVCESWKTYLKGATLDYGNYNMEAFEFGGVIGFRNQTAADFVHSVTLTVGDVSVKLSGVADQSYTVTATYKGNALPLLKTDGSEFTTTAWANTGAKYADYQATHAAIMAARGVTSGWFSVSGKWPNTTQPVKIGYANGVLTLYTGSNSKDTWQAVATAALADANFTNANVSLTLAAGKGSWYVHNIAGQYKGTVSTAASSETASQTSSQTSSQTASQSTSSQTASQSTSSETSSQTASQTPSSSASGRDVVTTEMGGLDKATCEIPEDLPWNSAGSGLGKTSLTGDALFVGGQNAEVNLTANVGTYAINSYFKLNFDLFAKTGSLKKNGVAEGNESWVVTVGDFEFTFTRPTLEEAKANEHTMLKSVKYKGTELTITGDTIYTPEHRVKHDYNDPKTLTAAEEFKKFTEDTVGRLGWMFTNGLPEKANQWPTFHHSVEIVYDNGKITVTGGIGNDGGVDPVVATVDATSVVDATKALGSCAVSVNGHATAARKTYISAIGNFKGAYEKIAGAVDNGGSGNSGSGNGNGGGAVSGGDTRNMVLPLAVMMACLAAGALVLINRKQNA